MRNRQLVRVLRLRDMLVSGRLTLNELAAELRVTTRTIRRDLEALQEAHVPVHYHRSNNEPDEGESRWWIR